MEVYLDNSATTRCYDIVGDTVYRVMCEDYERDSCQTLEGAGKGDFLHIRRNGKR